jgi:hypothetical protein
MASPISRAAGHLSPKEIKEIHSKIKATTGRERSPHNLGKVDKLLSELSANGAQLSPALKERVSIWKRETLSSAGSSGGASAELALLPGGVSTCDSTARMKACMSAVSGASGEIIPRSSREGIDLGKSLRTSLDKATANLHNTIGGMDGLIDGLIEEMEKLDSLEQRGTALHKKSASAAIERCISAADALATGYGVESFSDFVSDSLAPQIPPTNKLSRERPDELASLVERREELEVLSERLNNQMISEAGSTSENLFILYVIRQTLLFGCNASKIHSCLDQLEEFLLALDCPDREVKREILGIFFTFMTSIKLKRDSTPTPECDDLIFRIGLQKCIIWDIDFLSRTPVKSEVPEGSPLATSIALKKAPALDSFDEGAMEQKFTMGCRATQYLAQMTCTLGDEVAVFIYAIAEKHSIPLHAIEAAIKYTQLKIRTLRKLPPEIERDLFHKRKIKSMFDLCESFTHSLAEPYKHLNDLIAQYKNFIEGFHSRSLKRMAGKLRALQAAGAGVEQKRLIQFSLTNENYDEILNNRNLILSYLEELIAALNEVKVAQELSAYLLMFNNDPEITIESKASQIIQSIKSTTLRYKESHSNPQFERFSGECREQLSVMFKPIEETNVTVKTLTILQEQLSRSNELIESTYLADFMCLGDLIQRGMIRMEESRSMPIFSRPRVFPLALDPEESIIKRSVEAEKVEEPALRASMDDVSRQTDPLSSADFSRALQALVPVNAFSNAVGSSGQSARHAYITALHYVESLYTLLTQQSECLPDGKSLAQLQMDIGFASFHALEQLSTAMMILEKEKSQSVAALAKKDRGASKGSSDSSLFDEVGHSLIGRLLEAKITPPKSVRMLLRDTEGMEFAIRNLSKPYKIPPLLEHTARLLSNAEIAPSELLTEERRSREYGQSILEAFASLLSTFSSNGRQSRRDPIAVASYLRVVQASIPATAAGETGLFEGVKTEGEKPAIGSYKKATTSSLGIFPIDSLARLNVDFQQILENSEIRKFALEHNFNRFCYLISCLEDPSNLPLFLFYSSQARFVLCTLMEEILCAAHESTIGPVDQKKLAHSLLYLAFPLGIKLAHLSSEERNFLSKAASIRNEARYGYKPKAHFAPTVARGTYLAPEPAEDTEAGSGASSEGWELVLSRAYTDMTAKLREELAAVVSLGNLVYRQIICKC